MKINLNNSPLNANRGLIKQGQLDQATKLRNIATASIATSTLCDALIEVLNQDDIDTMRKLPTSVAVHEYLMNRLNSLPKRYTDLVRNVLTTTSTPNEIATFTVELMRERTLDLSGPMYQAVGTSYINPYVMPMQEAPKSDVTPDAVDIALIKLARDTIELVNALAITEIDFIYNANEHACIVNSYEVSVEMKSLMIDNMFISYFENLWEDSDLYSYIKVECVVDVVNNITLQMTNDEGAVAKYQFPVLLNWDEYLKPKATPTYTEVPVVEEPALPYSLIEVAEINADVDYGRILGYTKRKCRFTCDHDLQLSESQIYRLSLLASNRAVTHLVELETLEDMIVEGVLVTDLFKYIPRYSNDGIQSCNLLVMSKHADDSIKMTTVAIAENRMNSDYINIQYHETPAKPINICVHVSGEIFKEHNGLWSIVTELDTPYTALVVQCATIFQYRYQTFVDSVRGRMQQVVNTEVNTEEYAAEVYCDYHVGLAKAVANPDTKGKRYHHVTITNITPCVPLRYLNVIKPTAVGTKKSPHDRGSHKNYRYNEDGTVRLEWDVPAAEINGGAKMRYGLQISRIVKR